MTGKMAPGEIAIIGGGLAGCAAAISLAGHGIPVSIFERDTFPRKKLCGEFLSGESRALLAEFGCLDEILRYNPPEITRARFISASGQEVLVPLPRPALGISRRVLDEVLFRRACEAGASGYENSEVTAVTPHRGGGGTLALPGGAETVEARFIIGAYGRHSRLDRQLGREFVGEMDGSVGIKRHCYPAPGQAGRRAMEALAGTTEIYSLGGGYCGISLVEGGAINVCMLLTKKLFIELKSTEWELVNKFLGSVSPALGKRLEGLAHADEPVLSVAQMPFGKMEPVANGILYPGDGAAMIAPVVGDGMAMALESGKMLGDVIAKGYTGGLPEDEPDFAKIASAWEKAWRSRYEGRIKLAGAIQQVIFNRPLANTAFWLLGRGPGAVPRFLARATRG